MSVEPLASLGKEEKTSDAQETNPIKTDDRLVIYCDGAYNGTSKPYGWATVVTADGTDLVNLWHESVLSELACGSSEGKFEVERHSLLTSSSPKTTSKKRASNSRVFVTKKRKQTSGGEGKKGVSEAEIENSRMVIKIKHGNISQQTNSAELLALTFAIKVANRLTAGKVKEVRTDAKFLYNFWSKGGIQMVSSTKKEEFLNECPEKLWLIETCAKERAEWEKSGGVVVWIPGKENVADMGAHKDKKKRAKKKK